MANYAIARYTTEDFDYAKVASNLETQLETLDSTTNPIVLSSLTFNPKSGKYVGVLLTGGAA